MLRDLNNGDAGGVVEGAVKWKNLGGIVMSVLIINTTPENNPL